MLYKDNGEWKLSEKKITYIENNGEVENFICSEGEEWWNSYVKLWGVTVKSIEDLEYTEEQVNRLSEIKDIPEGYSDICIEYVLNGAFPTYDNHPLKSIQLSKTIDKLNNENFTLMIALAETYEELQILKGGIE